MHPLVIPSLAVSLQQHLQSPIPEPRFLSRQLHQPPAQLFIAALGRIPIARRRHPHQTAHATLAHPVLRPQPFRTRAIGYEPHPFFAITAFSISRSRLRSTTSFFSRAFSSLNCFASCASLTSIPPYFAFHA